MKFDQINLSLGNYKFLLNSLSIGNRYLSVVTVICFSVTFYLFKRLLAHEKNLIKLFFYKDSFFIFCRTVFITFWQFLAFELAFEVAFKLAWEPISYLNNPAFHILCILGTIGLLLPILYIFYFVFISNSSNFSQLGAVANRLKIFESIFDIFIFCFAFIITLLSFNISVFFTAASFLTFSFIIKYLLKYAIINTNNYNEVLNKIYFNVDTYMY